MCHGVARVLCFASTLSTWSILIGFCYSADSPLKQRPGFVKNQGTASLSSGSSGSIVEVTVFQRLQWSDLRKFWSAGLRLLPQPLETIGTLFIEATAQTDRRHGIQRSKHGRTPTWSRRTVCSRVLQLVIDMNCWQRRGRTHCIWSSVFGSSMSDLKLLIWWKVAAGPSGATACYWAAQVTDCVLMENVDSCLKQSQRKRLYNLQK